jgi:hypothetical protein
MVWADADSACQANGGYLATIANEEEDDFVAQGGEIVAAACWIGLTDQAVEGTWEWVTGEAVNYTRWRPGQPDSQGGQDDEDGVTINPSNHDDYPGHWHDQSVDDPFHFVMECDGPSVAGGGSWSAMKDLYRQAD